MTPKGYIQWRQVTAEPQPLQWVGLLTADHTTKQVAIIQRTFRPGESHVGYWLTGGNIHRKLKDAKAEAESRLSFKVGVKTHGDDDYVYNSIRYRSYEQAEYARQDLISRWTAVTDSIVSPSTDLVTEKEA